jgi:hypothetical protein
VPGSTLIFAISALATTAGIMPWALLVAAEALATKILQSPKEFMPELGDDGSELIGALAEPTSDLNSLIEPILSLGRKLRGES